MEKVTEIKECSWTYIVGSFDVKGSLGLTVGRMHHGRIRVGAGL